MSRKYQLNYPVYSFEQSRHSKEATINGIFATLGPDKRPIISKRDQRMGCRAVLYLSESQPTSQPVRSGIKF